MIFSILDNTTELWMTKYIIVEIFNSSGAILYKNHSDQSVTYIGRSFINTYVLEKSIPICIFRVITWPWEITFVPLWIVLCISLVGVLYTIIFAGILLRMTDINAEQRRTSTNSALGTYQYINIF